MVNVVTFRHKHTRRKFKKTKGVSNFCFTWSRSFVFAKSGNLVSTTNIKRWYYWLFYSFCSTSFIFLAYRILSQEIIAKCVKHSNANLQLNLIHIQSNIYTLLYFPHYFCCKRNMKLFFLHHYFLSPLSLSVFFSYIFFSSNVAELSVSVLHEVFFFFMRFLTLSTLYHHPHYYCPYGPLG